MSTWSPGSGLKLSAMTFSSWTVSSRSAPPRRNNKVRPRRKIFSYGFGAALARARIDDGLPHAVRRERERGDDGVEPEGVRDGVRDGTTGARGARLADTFDAERIGARGAVLQYHQIDDGTVGGHRHSVIHERSGEELAALVVDQSLSEGVPQPEDDATVQLSLDDTRIDRAPDVTAHHV